MVQRRGKAENESGLKRAAAITGAVLLFAWVAKSVIWKQGTAEFEELEQRKQAKLDEYFRFADQRTKPAVDWSSVEEAVEREEALLEAARSRA